MEKRSSSVLGCFVVLPGMAGVMGVVGRALSLRPRLSRLRWTLVVALLLVLL